MLIPSEQALCAFRSADYGKKRHRTGAAGTARAQQDIGSFVNYITNPFHRPDGQPGGGGPAAGKSARLAASRGVVQRIGGAAAAAPHDRHHGPGDDQRHDRRAGVDRPFMERSRDAAPHDRVARGRRAAGRSRQRPRRVLRITTPSLPTRPTTAEAATTLCTQIVLPAAPPTACRATIQVGSTPIRCPTSNWNSENIMLLTVLLPATAAPIPPMNGGKDRPGLTRRAVPRRRPTRWASSRSRRRRRRC